jgi:uncharacterized protein
VNRITADSNIYISAYLRGGKPRELLDLARAGHIELAISEDILSETTRVLLTKFRVSPEDIQEFVQEVRGFTKSVSPTETLDAVPDDVSDNRILECAVAGEAEVVVTGDGHLLSLVSFRGIAIMRIADFLQRLTDRTP